MDTKFQTSFIPKKNNLADQKVIRRSSSPSILMFISVILFIVSVAGAVFSIGWRSVLIKSQESYKVELKAAEEKFNTALIDELREANAKLDLSKVILKNHIAVSEVFDIISRLTIEGVRFTSFRFIGPRQGENGVNVVFEGVGNSFSAIAYQSDVFGQSIKFGKNKVLRNPLISDLVLDERGNVKFTFKANIDTEDISYEKVLDAELNQTN